MWQAFGKDMQSQVLRRKVLVMMCMAGMTGMSGHLMAQSAAWPVQALKLVVGFPAGSSPDLTARTLAEPLSQALGQPVIVENKPGAGGNIGAAAVAQARDGHTLGLMINGNLTTAKLLNPATPYDPHQDLAPVSLIATAPLVLAAAQPLPAQGAALFSAGQQAGTAWSYGSPGVGTVAHLGMEWLKARAGWSAVHVPYPGNPQVINGLLSGQIQVALLPPGLVMVQAKAGKLHAVGLTSAGRSSLVPEVPSLAEAGLSGFQLEIWNAVAAPKTMPDAHIQKVANALTEIVRRPEMRQKLLNQGWQVAGTAPEGLALRIKADTTQMAQIIQKQQLKAQ
jgi:tripartite-type tricarboxylate transporter receptor subunit TctC